MPPSRSRVGKRLKFLVHIAMSSAYLIFICEASKHRDRGSHWEERMVEANEGKKREIKERKNKHKVGRENLSFKSGLFTHSQWSQNVQRVQRIGSETKLEAHYSTFFCGTKKNPTHWLTVPAASICALSLMPHMQRTSAKLYTQHPLRIQSISETKSQFYMQLIYSYSRVVR